MAVCLGRGSLCSEDILGCHGDDTELGELLAAHARPDRRGWAEVPAAAVTGYRRQLRWYGTTDDGQRVYVAVEFGDPIDPHAASIRA